MKVLRLHAPGDLRQHDEGMPEAAGGEVLLQVKAVGICGSDLHWFGEAGIGDAKLQRPLVLGHEFAAVIAAGPRQGTRVAVDPAVPCHTCEFCLQGDPNLCEHIRFAGHGTEDGALRRIYDLAGGMSLPSARVPLRRGRRHARTAGSGHPCS